MATALCAPSDLDRRRNEYMAVIRDPGKSEGAKLKAKVGMIETAREQIAAVTSREIASRVIGQAVQLLREDPKLAAVDVGSLITCVARAAMLDLRLGGLRPEAYIVPIPKRAKKGDEWVTIRTDANLWPSYHGWTSLVRRTNRMGRDPVVSCVFEGEEFSAILEDGLLICRHKAEALNANRRSGKDDTIAYVWVRWTIDGRPTDFLMSRAEIEEHKKQYSKKPHGGEWNWDTKWREMAEKTVIIMSVRRGHVPACFDLEDIGFADEETAAAPIVDLSVVDGECAPSEDDTEPVAMLEAPQEPVTAPAAGKPLDRSLSDETPRQSFERYEARLAECTSTKDCANLYAAFFGGDSPHQWTDEDRGLANELRAKRVDAIRGVQA